MCFALFALLAVAFKQEWALIVDIDDASREWRDWALDDAWLHDPLRWVEVAFGTVGMTVLTTVLAVAMFAKGYRRAAAFAVGVMIATARHHHLAEGVARPRRARCGSRSSTCWRPTRSPPATPLRSRRSPAS